MAVRLAQAPADLSLGKLWTGRILSGLATLFLLMDGAMKLANPAPVVEASEKLGYAPGSMFGIGLLLLVCTFLYAIPRTAVLGAVLLTGYLGGAVATNVRVSAPTFSIVFPLLMGALVWAGLYVRDGRLRTLLPLRLA